jgi:hypothetical protein
VPLGAAPQEDDVLGRERKPERVHARNPSSGEAQTKDPLSEDVQMHDRLSRTRETKDLSSREVSAENRPSEEVRAQGPTIEAAKPEVAPSEEATPLPNAHSREAIRTAAPPREAVREKAVSRADRLAHAAVGATSGNAVGDAAFSRETLQEDTPATSATEAGNESSLNQALARDVPARRDAPATRSCPSERATDDSVPLVEAPSVQWSRVRVAAPQRMERDSPPGRPVGGTGSAGAVDPERTRASERRGLECLGVADGCSQTPRLADGAECASGDRKERARARRAEQAEEELAHLALIGDSVPISALDAPLAYLGGAAHARSTRSVAWEPDSGVARVLEDGLYAVGACVRLDVADAGAWRCPDTLALMVKVGEGTGRVVASCVRPVLTDACAGTDLRVTRHLLHLTSGERLRFLVSSATGLHGAALVAGGCWATVRRLP